MAITPRYIENMTQKGTLEDADLIVIKDMTEEAPAATTMKAVAEFVAAKNSGYYAGDVAPDNTDLLWLDTGIGGVLKYYDSSASSWKAVAAVWS